MAARVQPHGDMPADVDIHVGPKYASTCDVQACICRDDALTNGTRHNKPTSKWLQHAAGLHRWRRRLAAVVAAIPWQHILNAPTCSALLGESFINLRHALEVSLG